MSTTVIPEMPGQEIPAESRVNYLNASYGVKSWLLTTDHKRIALLYLGSITLMFFVGGLFAVLMRLHLIEPQGALVAPETYNKLFTMHGVIMVFFFLVPSIPATLGNFLVPMMIGARDLAFPRLNLLSWYIYIIGAAFTLYAVISGGVDTGWTFYTPYSSSFSHTSVIPTALGVFITGFSSILTGLNFIVTIHKMRAPGMTWFRLPLFIWAMYATSIIFILGTPVIAITIFLLGLERLLHIGIFDPAIGGDPILFQHLFWFYSHPAVYIMILPGMGVISELITCFFAQADFRLQLRGVFQPGDRGDQLPGLGPSHVRHRPIHLRRADFFGAELPGGDSFGRESFQLDRDALQRLDFLRRADALRAGLHRPVHHGRPDRIVPRIARHRRAFERHLFHRRAFSLHHGGRRGDGVPGRHSFLVAENYRAPVSGRLGAIRRADYFRRIQPDVLPAIRAGLSGHAAALRRLSR